jgi:hypothetical protein
MFYEVVRGIQALSASGTAGNGDTRRVVYECIEIVAADFGLKCFD